MAHELFLRRKLPCVSSLPAQDLAVREIAARAPIHDTLREALKKTMSEAQCHAPSGKFISKDSLIFLSAGLSSAPSLGPLHPKKRAHESSWASDRSPDVCQHVQIGTRQKSEKSVAVLVKYPIGRLSIAEDVLHHVKDMLNLRPD